MQTHITRSKARIALVIDDKSLPLRDRPILASMTLHEGTGCWQLVDIRLTKYRKPNPYAGDAAACDYCASYQPENPEEAEYVKSRLREYKELEDGTIIWCSFDGIVRGHSSVNGYTPVRWADFDQAGYFSQAEGVALLYEIKEFWDAHPDLDHEWRIDNPYRQPTESQILSETLLIKNGHFGKEEFAGRDLAPAISRPKP